MYTTWDISFQSLKGKDHEAWSILMAAAFLSHHSLPIAFFKPCVNDGPEVPLTKHTTTLYNYALIRMKDSGTAFSIHDIIRRCALWYLRKDTNTETFQGAMRNAATAINGQVDDLGKLKTRAERVSAMREKDLATHIECLCNNLAQLLKEEPSVNPADVDLLESGRFLLSLNYDKPAERILRYMQLKKEGLYGPTDPSTLECMSALSGACEHFGLHVESLELRERVLASRREVLGEDHPDTIESMGDLARTYNYHKRYEEAIGLQQRVIAWHTTKYGEYAPLTLGTKMNVSQTYKDSAHLKKLEARIMQSSGEVDEAKAFMEQAERELVIAEAEALKVLEATRARCSEQHQLATQKYLCDIYMVQERYDKAEEQAVQNLETSRRIHSADDNDPRNITYMSCIAECYLEHAEWLDAHENYFQGQEYWEKAGKLLLQLTELRKSVFGEGHPDTLSARRSLALALRRMPGNEDVAHDLGFKTLETSKKYLGDDHRITCLCKGLLVLFVAFYELTSRFEEAKELQARIDAGGDDAYDDPNSDSDLERRIHASIMKPRPKVARWFLQIMILWTLFSSWILS